MGRGVIAKRALEGVARRRVAHSRVAALLCANIIHTQRTFGARSRWLDGIPEPNNDIYCW